MPQSEAREKEEAAELLPGDDGLEEGLDEEGLATAEHGSSTADAGPSRREGGGDGGDRDADEEEANEEIQDYRGFAALVGGGAKGAKGAKGTKSAKGTKGEKEKGSSAAPLPSRKKQISSQSIRKGEKDFEEHGTRAQRDALEQSRSVMESVLAHTRVHYGGGGGGGGGGSGSGGSAHAPAGSAADTIRGWYFPDVWADEDSEPPAAPAAPANDSDAPARRFAHTRHRVVMVEMERGSVFASVGAVPGRPAWIPGLPKEEQTPPKPGFDRVWLLPEEALFLVERGSMELWYPLQPIETILGASAEKEEEEEEEDGIPLSLQAAYSLLIGPDVDAVAGDPAAQRPGSTDQESQSQSQSRGRIALPAYQVYTHLRRSGYQVLRAVHSDPQTPLDPEAGASGAVGAAASSSQPQPQPAHASAVTNLWQWLSSLAGLGGLGAGRGSSQAPSGPLVKPGIYRSYEPIYAQLRLASPPPAASPPSPSPSSSPSSSSSASPFRIVFHVWKAGRKGAAPFSKTRPPPPDFYMAVADAHTTGVPTLGQVTALLASVPPLAPAAASSPPSYASSSSSSSSSSFPPLPVIYRRLKLGRRCVIVSVVDHGIVNYMRFADGTFDAEPLHARFDDVASGKFAGRGGGGKHGKGKGKGKGGKPGGSKGGKASGKEAAPDKGGKA